MADAMSRDPSFIDVNSDLQINATQATLIVDRSKASSLGISAAQLRSTLYPDSAADRFRPSTALATAFP